MHQNFKSIATWFIQVLLVTGIFVVPTARIHIFDKLPNEYGLESAARTVDGVPLGLAFMASITSKTGYFLMEKFEDAFSGTFPHTKRSNILFGSKIIEDTMELRPEDNNIKAAFSSFTKQCLLRDIAAGKLREGGFTVKELSDSENILEFLAKRTAKERRMYYNNEIKALNTSGYTQKQGIDNM